MKILIGCEESQTVCKAFRDKGHEAYSCDIIPCSGGYPEWHYKMDLFKCIEKYGPFDMLIAHPPCTYLTVTANKWLKDQPARKSGALVGAARRAARENAIKFFMKIALLPVDKIAIENPVGCISSEWRKPDQIIQPYEYGHEASKSTCLWLKNLSLLQATNIVGKGEFTTYKSGKRIASWYADAAKDPETRAKIRNKTFEGIAAAMAKQWGGEASINETKNIQSELFV